MDPFKFSVVLACVLFWLPNYFQTFAIEHPPTHPVFGGVNEVSQCNDMAPTHPSRIGSLCSTDVDNLVSFPCVRFHFQLKMQMVTLHLVSAEAQSLSYIKKKCTSILLREQGCPDPVLESRNVPRNSVPTLLGQKARLDCGSLGLVTSALECWHHHNSDVLLNVKSVTIVCILPAKTDQILLEGGGVGCVCCREGFGYCQTVIIDPVHACLFSLPPF